MKALQKEADVALKSSGRVSDDLARKLSLADQKASTFQSRSDQMGKDRRGAKELRKDIGDYRGFAGHGMNIYGATNWQERIFAGASLAGDRDVLELAGSGLQRWGGRAGKWGASLIANAGPIGATVAMGIQGVQSGVSTLRGDTNSIRDISRMAARGDITGAEQRAAQKAFENQTYLLFNQTRGEAASNTLKGIRGTAGAFGGKTEADIAKTIKSVRGWKAGQMSAEPLAGEIHRNIKKAINSEEGRLKRRLTKDEREAATRAAIARSELTQETMDAIVKANEAKEDSKNAKGSGKTGAQKVSEFQSKRIEQASLQRRTPARIGD